jgi:hypothetical protein
MCALTNLASAIKLDRANDFWVDNKSIFINDFDISSRMCRLMNSASTIKPDRADNS